MDQALQVTTEAAFVLIFILTLLDVVRRRDRERVEVALLFGTLAGTIVLLNFSRATGGSLPWLGVLGALLLVAQPYLLLRLVEHFRPVPALQRLIGLAALVASWCVLLLGGSPLPQWASLTVVIAFVYVEGYAGIAFVRATSKARGVTRRRLIAVALGSLLLAAVFVLAGVGAGVPAAASFLTPFSRVLALASAVSYYIGFAPPRWLVRSWRMAEFRPFLDRHAEFDAEDRLADEVERVSAAANGLFAAKAVVVALGEPGDSELTIDWDASAQVSEDGSHRELAKLSLDGPILSRAWNGNEPSVTSVAEDWGRSLRELAAVCGGAASAVLVPLAAHSRKHGILIVFLERRQLFIRDEVALLVLLARQAALAMENRQLFDHLHRRAEEKEALLGQLRQQNAALEQASRMKSEFLANMSHELRTPLNAIIGFTELLLDEPDQEGYDRQTRQAYLQTVHQGGQHLLALINDILDLSKVEAGKMELRPEPVRIEQLVAQVLSTVKPLAASKGVVLATSANGPTELEADAGKLKQILYNLVSNAIKFTPEGGSVTVEMRRLEDELQVTVVDTGIGIAPDDQERVFQEFQQVDAGPGRRYEGTGLGLALTKRFVELHGGRVWLESAVGAGSRFHFTLPLRTVHPSADRKTEASVNGPAIPPPVQAGRGPVVLVVEDDPRSMNLLSQYLTRGGYHVETATDGAMALDKTRALKPFAVLLDILLPDLDGWEVLRALKDDPTTREIPVVVVSVTDNQELGYALGADDYFVKPIDRQALLERLRRYSFTTKVQEQPVRVLVIDDEPVAIDLMEGFLNPAGFSVLRATNGGDGIALAQREHPDLVLLDLMMPGMSGFDVVVALKADPATRDIPILIVTAQEVSAESRDILNGQVEAVLRKGTFGRVELLAWLEELLGRQGVLVAGSGHDR